jgi:cyanophycin synthetase
MEDYLASQGLHLDSIPSAGQRVNLRKIANISAGGVSVNVTDQVHPANRLLVESVAGYFGVTCLGIDVIAADISRPWTEGQFGIIEINAGPGIFMHTAPAKGEPVDVPGMVMDAFFPNVHAARVPIIAGNRMSPALCEGLSERLRHLRPSLRIATLSDGGQPRLQGRAIAGTVSHRVALRTILRHPHTQAAVLSHNKDTLFDDGTIHHGADVVILREPHYAEEILSRDLLPGGILVTVADGHLLLHRDGVEVGRLLLDNSVDLDQAIPAALTPFLPAILDRYGL